MSSIFQPSDKEDPKTKGMEGLDILNVQYFLTWLFFRLHNRSV